MTVTEFARCAGITTHAVRYYTRVGLLTPMRHRDNGYKLFTERDRRRLDFIRKAQDLGYKLSEIAEFIATAECGQSPCSQVREVMSKRVEENRLRLNGMILMQKRMEEALRIWEQLPDGHPDGKTICYLIETNT